MKDKLLTLAIGACVAGSILSMCLFFLPKKGRIDVEVVPDAFQRLGPVRQQTETKVDYTIRNRASVPIRIIDVVTSCGCTVVELPKRELGPGESGTLTLTFGSGARRGSVVVRGMIAYKREGEKESHTLPIGVQAEIDPDYAVEPEQLHFGDGRPLAQRVSISPRHISELRIENATCNLRFFTARVLPKDVSNGQEIEVTFLQDGYYPDAGFPELIVTTDSKRQPTLRIPLEVTVRNPRPAAEYSQK